MSSPALPLPINYADEHLYEHLSLIIDEFEKAALRSGDRQGIMATAQAPLGAMDQVLASSDKALTMGRTANAKRVSSPSSSGRVPTPAGPHPAGSGSESGTGSTTSGSTSGSTSDGWEAPGFRIAGSGLNKSGEQVKSEPWSESHNDLKVTKSDGVQDLSDKDEPLPEPSFEVGTKGSVEFDADFNELLNGSPGGAQFGDWLKDCLGCDLRISFDWQLQPIDLLLPIGDLLADINAALGQFEGFFDENRLMNSLCDLLNGLNLFCIPDLLAILMALKMLLKSYLTFQLSIKLDWTLILGPLLKLILDAIVTLLQQIAGIIVAPLDCAYAALMSIAKLQDELAETAALAAAVGARVADRATGGTEGNTTEVDSRFKDVTGTSKEVQGNQDEGGFLPDVSIPALSVSARDGDQKKAAGSDFSFPTGFEIDSDTKLPDALKVPEFLQSNPFKQLALSVKEAKDYIMDLVKKIILALRSLEGLVSGSLSLSLGNLGLLLFIRDMIRLIIMIIKLFTQWGGDVKDWCDFLRDNPEVLEGVFPEGSKAKTKGDMIVISRGPEVVAEINTCSTGRTDAQAALMKKWVQDLKRAGSL